MAAFAGITGAVTSWAGTQNTQLISTGSEPAEFTLNPDALEFDVTTFSAAGFAAWLKGLQSWTVSITSQLKTATTGDLGLVTYSAGYVTNLNRWGMTLSTAVLETTPFGTTAARTFIPGKFSGEGSYGGWQDDTTVLTLPGNSNEPATGTFKVREAGATDDTLAASIFTKQLTGHVSANSGEPASAEYAYRISGAVTQSTPSAGTTIFPTGSIARPAVGELVLTAVSGQTFTGNAFWSSVRISVAVNQPTTVTIEAQGTGALSPA